MIVESVCFCCCTMEKWNGKAKRSCSRFSLSPQLFSPFFIVINRNFFLSFSARYGPLGGKSGENKKKKKEATEKIFFLLNSNLPATATNLTGKWEWMHIILLQNKDRLSAKTKTMMVALRGSVWGVDADMTWVRKPEVDNRQRRSLSMTISPEKAMKVRGLDKIGTPSWTTVLS